METKLNTPLPLAAAPLDRLARIDVILTDVDDTLTHRGRLYGAVLDALERLRASGIRVVPATAASAGWASAISHMWPVDAVIAENGNLAFIDQGQRLFWDDDAGPALAQLRAATQRQFPQLAAAADAPYRERTLAFDRPADAGLCAEVLDFARRHGAGGTLNSLWLLLWVGDVDKRLMAQRLLAERWNIDLERDTDRLLYVGDSENDQPMFRAIPNSVGVSTVLDHSLTDWPRWISQGSGGAGFVEVADRLLAARQGCAST